MTQYSNRSLEIFLVFFCFCIYIAGIGNSSILTQGDESDYIRSSQEMFENGDFLSPTLRGELRFTKPPMLYWMVIGSYKILDVSFFSSRLPTVICAVLTILFVFRMGLLLFDKESALISALLTATCFGMVKFSKIVLMESPLILTFLLAFYYFVRFYKEEKGYFLVISFGFLGLSALLKSPVYSVIGAGAMILFLITEGKQNRLYNRYILIGGLLAAIIALPWYVAMITLHGPLFTDFYLDEHVNKFAPMPHFILRVWMGLLLYMLPWAVYVLYATVMVFYRGLFRTWNFKLLLIVMGLFLLVFMIPNQKGLYYSIPLLPYCGLMTGGVLGSRFAPGKFWDVLTALILIIAGLVFAASIGLLDTEIWFSMLASGLAITAAVFLLLGYKTPAIILAGCSLIPLYTHIFPSINFEIVPVKRTLAISTGKPLHSYRISPLKFANALDREVEEVLEPAELERSIDQGGFVIISEEEYRFLDDSLKNRSKILLEWKRWQRRIPFKKFYRAVFDGKPEQLHQNVFLISG